ncbi:very short patch repair endonuclease [Streptomyces sp. YIM 121038]|uniref:very short patch repair endonuclease n=1 Tax=Streptomyces sp. YIM 121038 TaxID=2136401 RepID=UPI0020173FC5|nr:very short patch repair endonuclease [Streptomyces sp. YIM 121038]
MADGDIRAGVLLAGVLLHACPRHLHAPPHNAEWWQQKLQGNARRGEETNAHLVSLGWLPLRVWEHAAFDTVVDRVVAALAHRVHPRAPRMKYVGKTIVDSPTP